MFWRVVIRSLWGRRSRLGLALLAVALGVTIAVALGTLSLQVGDELARTLRAAGPNFVVRPAGAAWEEEGDAPPLAVAGATLPANAVGLLKETFWRNHLLAAAPAVTAAALSRGVPFRLEGTYFARDVRLSEGGIWRTGIADLQPTWKLRGRWPAERARDELALGSELAAKLGAGPGDEIALGVAGREARWRVAGVVESGGFEARWAWAPLEAVQGLTGGTPGIERVWVSALTIPSTGQGPPDRARDPAGFERYLCTPYPEVVAQDLAAAVPGSEALPRGEVVAAEGRVVGRLNFMMLLLALASVVASALGLAATTFAAVVERTGEIGLLRALGAAPEQVTALLLGETLTVSLAGGVAGFVAGSLAAKLVGGMGAGAAVEPKLALLPVALTLSALIGLAATWVPLRAARRVNPAEALRG